MLDFFFLKFLSKIVVLEEFNLCLNLVLRVLMIFKGNEIFMTTFLYVAFEKLADVNLGCSTFCKCLCFRIELALKFYQFSRIQTFLSSVARLGFYIDRPSCSIMINKKNKSMTMYHVDWTIMWQNITSDCGARKRQNIHTLKIKQTNVCMYYQWHQFLCDHVLLVLLFKSNA